MASQGDGEICHAGTMCARSLLVHDAVHGRNRKKKYDTKYLHVRNSVPEAESKPFVLARDDEIAALLFFVRIKSERKKRALWFCTLSLYTWYFTAAGGGRQV